MEKFCVAAGLPLLVSAGLVQLAALTLGDDTDLVHLAVAQGRRVVLLLRHNRLGACVPFQHPDWAIVPEGPDCNIREITVERGIRPPKHPYPRSINVIA